jgi:hypothetical protein
VYESLICTSGAGRAPHYKTLVGKQFLKEVLQILSRVSEKPTPTRKRGVGASRNRRNRNPQPIVPIL